MTMQLFSFGHPCEHQLRRTCIGGNSCPLNGYPDAWCCSYVKGKINFKRDKPCEGARCRWGFTHPTPQQFDAVTQIINEARTIAVKLDEAKGSAELLSFQIDSSHITDTVHCSLHLMHHAASSSGRGVGQLLCYAALRSHDPKVFTQLLKTMKKPIDQYLLGAYDYIVHATKSAKGGKGAKEGSKAEAVSEELRSDIVDVMAAALSQGGQLVHRDDQQVLQGVFLAALRTFPKQKKKQELLEAATAKFKNTAVAPSAAGAATTAASAAAAAEAADTTVAVPASVIKSMQEAPALGSTPTVVPTATSKKKQKTATSAATATAVATAADSTATPVAADTKTTASTATTPATATVAPAANAQPPQRVQIIGLSKYASVAPAAPRPYDPVRHPSSVDVPFLGGLLGIGTPGILGLASSKSGLERLTEGLATGLVVAAAPTAVADAFSPFATGNAVFGGSSWASLS